MFVDTVKLHGLDRAIFSLSTEHDDIDVPAELGIIHNYPRDWLDYYFEHGFNHIDPVLIHAANKVGMFEWSEIPRYLELCAKSSGSASISARRPDCRPRHDRPAAE